MSNNFSGDYHTNLYDKITLFNSALKNINGVFFINDVQTKNLFWIDEKISEITGYNQEEIGFNGLNNIDCLYHPDDLNVLNDKYEFFMSKNETDKPFTSIQRLRHKRGYYIWVYLCLFIIERNNMGMPVKTGGLLIQLDKFSDFSEIDNPISKIRKNEVFFDIKLLSKREKEVLVKIGAGLTCLEIAKALKLSKRTVETHKNNIRKKLNISKTSSLINFAISHGLS